MKKREMTRVINVAGVKIGGYNPISIQSMTNTDTKDVIATCKQIKKLQLAGCEIIRVAIPDMEAARAIYEIKKVIEIPLVADIHFDHRLALEAMKNGVDKLRINPGNIGNIEKIKRVVDMAGEKNIPIRIGVNSGSLEGDLLKKYNGVTAQGLVESAIRHVQILESLGFYDICVSIKSSNIPTSIDVYDVLSNSVDYPLHIGITEAGTQWSGAIKSAVGLGAILSRGIGNTIRVSLTSDPLAEIECAKEILKDLRLRKFGVEFTSCPTCGRTQVDLISIANKIEHFCTEINKNIRVAVMGCEVNGPGEARDADIGLACGKGCGLIFKKGQIYRKVEESQMIDALMEEIRTL